jgi:hypothetical protein
MNQLKLYTNTVNILNTFADSLISNQDLYSDDQIVPGIDVFADSLVSIQEWYASRADKKRQIAKKKANQAAARIRNLEAAGQEVSNTLRKSVTQNERKADKIRTNQEAEMANRLANQARESARNIEIKASNKATIEGKRNQTRMINVLQQVEHKHKSGKHLNRREAKILARSMGVPVSEIRKKEHKEIHNTSVRVNEMAQRNGTPNITQRSMQHNRMNPNSKKPTPSSGQTMKGWTDTISTNSGIDVSPKAHDHLSPNQKAKLLRKQQQAERKREKARELEKKRRLLREAYKKRRDESIKKQQEAIHPTPTHTPASTPTSTPTHTSTSTHTSTHTSTQTSTPKKSIWTLKHSAAVGAGSVAGGAGGYFLTRRFTRNMQPGYKRRLLRVAGTAAGAGLGGYAIHRLTK